MEKEEEEDEPPPDRMRKKETAVTPMSEFTFAQTLHFLLSKVSTTFSPPLATHTLTHARRSTNTRMVGSDLQ